MKSGAEDEGLALAPAEVARMLKIGERQAREWIAAGGIYSFRIGRRILVPRAALERLLNAESNLDILRGK